MSQRRATRRIRKDLDDRVAPRGPVVSDILPAGGDASSAVSGGGIRIGKVVEVFEFWRRASVKPLLTNPASGVADVFGPNICVEFLTNQAVVAGSWCMYWRQTFPGSSGSGKGTSYIGAIILGIFDENEYYDEPSAGEIGDPITTDELPMWVDPVDACESTITVNAEVYTGAVSVTPTDIDDAGNGTPPFTRRYITGTLITLVADTATAAFYWKVAGNSLPPGDTIQVNIGADITVVAVKPE